MSHQNQPSHWQNLPHVMLKEEAVQNQLVGATERVIRSDELPKGEKMSSGPRSYLRQPRKRRKIVFPSTTPPEITMTTLPSPFSINPGISTATELMNVERPVSDVNVPYRPFQFFGGRSIHDANAEKK